MLMPTENYNIVSCVFFLLQICKLVANENMEVEDVLTIFSYGPWNGYCLAHLFTSRDFEGISIMIKEHLILRRM